MRIHEHPDTAAALLLVGIAALHALLDRSGGWPEAGLRPPSLQRSLPAPGSSARRALEWCNANVSMIHDVYWASACVVAAEEQRRRGTACLLAAASERASERGCEAALQTPDDSPDCTLPEDRARPLNLARAKAEEQCLEEARGLAAKP